MATDCKSAAFGNLTLGAAHAPAVISGLRSGHFRNVPFGHTPYFSKALVVHSGLGDVIKKVT